MTILICQLIFTQPPYKIFLDLKYKNLDSKIDIGVLPYLQIYTMSYSRILES